MKQKPIFLVLFSFLIILNYSFSPPDPIIYTSLNTALQDSTTAEILDLSSQNINSLSADIYHLPNLKKLILSNNNQINLPQETALLSQLEELNLSNNQYTVLPAVLGNLNSLKKLILASNNLTHVAQLLANMQGLEELDLQGNSFDTEERNALAALLPNTTIHY